MRTRCSIEKYLTLAAGAMADYQAFLSIWPQAPDRGTVERWIDELSTVATTGGGVAQGVTR